MRHLKALSSLCFFLIATATAVPANALVVLQTIKGSDSIWLAGRTDLVIPDAHLSWPGGMLRHGGPTPEEIKETMPPGFAIAPGQSLRVLDPATGGISFFNGFGGLIYGPEGNGVPGSSAISAFGGISGYLGTQGALVGVFLSDAVPSAGAPATLDFTAAGLGTNFTSLSPGLGQVFYIGNGVTAADVLQEFIAPAGATRVFLGISDSFGFNGAPGAFDDNDGAYQIRVGINEDPNNPITDPNPNRVPEPATGALVLLALVLAGSVMRRQARVPVTGHAA